MRVTPRARHTTVGGRYGDGDPPVLLVRVTAPAADGRANAATVEAVARALGLPRSGVQIVAGAHARTKVIELDMDDPDAVAALLTR